MKYLRKILFTIIAAAFIASVVIGVGVIYAVKNVNVSLNCYSYEEGDAQANREIANYKQKILKKVRGTVIYFVDDGDIAGLIDGDYSLESVKKVYPCTLNVTLKERKETFSVALSGGNYALYDENGALLDGSATERNEFDVLLDIKNGDGVESAAHICSVFKSRFSAFRSVVKSVTLENAAFESMPYKNVVTMVLRCGATVEIADYDKNLGEKIDSVYECFGGLSSDKKTKGRIVCRTAADGGLNTVYQAAG